MSFVPYIPDTAPFSEEQRAWLNGFLAGIFSNAEARRVADPPPSLKIAVLYATQTGTAEGLARKIVKELKAKGHVVSLASLEGYTPAALAEERYAILVASTYGEGDPPACAQPFYQQLCIERFPRFQDLSYSVLAIGDSHYESFCKFGADLDAKLAALGALRIAPRVDCDVDLEEAFAQWKQSLYSALDQMVANRPAPNAPSSSLRSEAVGGSDTATSLGSATSLTHSRENPFFAPIVEKRPLTAGDSSKLTVHVTFSIADSDLRYQAGDACAVVPQNDGRLVDEILRSLKFSPQAPVQLPKHDTIPLVEALSNHLQITRVTRKMLEAYATIGACEALFGLLAPEQQQRLEKYTWDRGLIDLIHDYPGVLHSPADLVAMLPKLSPRLYSISSSPLAHTGEIHTTIAVVRYRTHGRERGGVCSTLLRSHQTGRSPADLYPAEQEIPPARRSQHSHGDDRSGHGNRPVSGISPRAPRDRSTRKELALLRRTQRCYGFSVSRRVGIHGSRWPPRATGYGLLSRPGTEGVRAGPHAADLRIALGLAAGRGRSLRLRRRESHGEGCRPNASFHWAEGRRYGRGDRRRLYA